MSTSLGKFETTDWEAEALRLRAAFNANEQLTFASGRDGHGMYARAIDPRKDLSCAGGYYFIAVYHEDYKYFQLGTLEGRVDYEVSVAIGWDGGLQRCSTDDLRHALPLARALHCLDLLTPQIEAALDVTVSAHEKLEWSSQYDERRRIALPVTNYPI